ncbi:MAG TPA: S41 family peptidase [Candidatus Acidoferrales bacterium]|nr:S41 family peptidase [Candidatus Acidoferrales bacterium]
MKHIPAPGRAVIAVFLLAAVAALPMHAQSPSQPKISNYDRQLAEEMLSKIHDAVKKDYYDPAFHGVDMDTRYKQYDAALKKAPSLGEAFRVIAAYLSGLRDSHTYFMPPSTDYRFDYGFRMEMIGDRCFVTEVRPGSDAAAKIHPGDEILKLGVYTVNRKDFRDIDYYLNELSPQGALELQLRDPQGAARTELVRTKFLPKEKVVDLSFRAGDTDFWNVILKEESMVHLLRERWVEIGDTLIWKIPAFNMTPVEVDEMMGKAKKHAALIIDLRGNPGGAVDSLAYLVGRFFDHDVTIATPVGRKHEKDVVAKPHGAPFTGKLFVLVDSGSASASELFARTMQLNHRATVIGDLSAGAVMESRLYPFQIGVTGGSDFLVFYGASITHDDLIMSDGKSLENVGVTPDVTVLPTGADLAAGRDPVLAQAVQLAGAKLDPAAAGKLFPFEWAPLR